MIRGLFSSTPSGLSLEDVLELVDEQLDNARNASTPAKALRLCDDAKASIKGAENILSKRVKGQALNNDIANAYQRLGKLLEELGQHNKAKKSYSKAKKWGYIHVMTVQMTSPQITNPSDINRQSLCLPTSTLAASSTTQSVHQGVSAVNDQTAINQGCTSGTNPAKSEDHISVMAKDTTQAQRTIFQRDASLPIAKFALPEPGGRITNTSQLSYCLSLLQHSLDSKERLDKTESDWSQALDNDTDEKERLKTMATDVIRAFVRDELQGPDAVAETVRLAAVLNQDDFRKLLGVFANGIEQSVLLKVHFLDGLAYLMKNTPEGSLDADDMVRILELLSTRLKGTHQQSTQHTYLLTAAISRVFDSMVDCQVEGLSRGLLHESLSQYLQDLQNSSDPCLVYQAAYAYQSLQHIPDDEKFLKSMMRRTGKLVQGISGVVSAVKAVDLDQFIDGLQHIQEGMSGVKDTISIVNDAYKDAIVLVESGKEFLRSLEEGLSFSRKSVWYPALRGLDSLIQEGRLTELEKLIRDAPCRRDPAFQWGVCQRLGEFASSAIWDIESRQNAITFLGEMYINDSQWGQQIHIRQWILRILSTLANSPEGDVANAATIQLQELDAVEDSSKNSFSQHYIDICKELHALTLTLPSPQQSRLLDAVQGKVDVNMPLRQLKNERLKGEHGDVYISPRARNHVNSPDSFDLASKVQEFLGSHKKVFLLLGDSGSGKSMFNRWLEIDLWNMHGKRDECIPLLIYLPMITDPGKNLIDKHLRYLNFTESQIRELKLHHEFILICDGYDESQQTRNLYISNQLNQPGQWRAQMVISCRTEYIDVDYKSCFQPNDLNNSGSSELFQEVVISPFNKDQIQDYINQYVIMRKPLWKSIDYQQALQQFPNLQDLVTNPFMLKIALEVLPHLLDTSNRLSTACITRVELYDEFVAQWIERGHIRLTEMDLNPRDQEALKMLSNSGFKQECISYLKELSVAIYDNQSGNPFVVYSERRDVNTWKGSLFNNLDGRNLMRDSIPLLHNGGQYGFVHKSLLEYGLSLAIFDPNSYCDSSVVPTCLPRHGSTSSTLSFENPILIEEPVIAIDQLLLDSPFGRWNFVDDPSISRFLVDRIQQQPVFLDQLHAVIERSKTDKATRTAAANAITMLVRAGIQFIGRDLRGIKVPGADLSYGMFDSAQLDGADLRKANLYNIWLRKATLCGAQMVGVKFGELPLLKEPDPVFYCAYSQDGKMLAIGLSSGGISLYDSSSWEKVLTLVGHVSYITHLVFLDTSEQIASGSKDGEARVWDVKTGDCLHASQGHGQVLTIALHSLGRYHVASQGNGNMVNLWEIETGNCFQTLKGHDDVVVTAAYSPNGDQVASGGRDMTVRLWNVNTGDCVHILVGHDDIVFGMVYSPDGGRVASGCIDKTIRLWDVVSGCCIHTLSGHDSRIHSIAYSPKGDQIASGGFDQTVKLWDVGTGDCIHTLRGHGGPIGGVIYSPNGDQVVSGSWDHTVRRWKVESSNFPHKLGGHVGSVMSFAKSPKGNQIASGSLDSTVKLWDVKTGECLHTLQGHYLAVFCIEYSPNGDQIASGGLDNTLRLWNVETGSCVHILEGHKDCVRFIKFSPNGDRVASGSNDLTMRLWDVETGDCIQILQGLSDANTSAVFSPKGDQIASGGDDKLVRLWNIESGECVQALQGHEEFISQVVYSPDGRQIASGSGDKTIRLWNVGHGDCIHVLEGHGSIAVVAYSPNGDQISSGSVGGAIRVWNVNTGDCIHNLLGHTADVLCITYLPTGDQIISGSADSTVRLWDAETGQFLVAVTGFSGPVSGIAWQDTSEGIYLATSSWDKSVRRWQIIKEQGEYQVYLCWSSSNDGLVVAEANFNDVKGLSQENWALLKQRDLVI